MSVHCLDTPLPPTKKMSEDLPSGGDDNSALIKALPGGLLRT